MKYTSFITNANNSITKYFDTHKTDKVNMNRKYHSIVPIIFYSLSCLFQSNNFAQDSNQNLGWSIISDVPDNMWEIFFVDSTRGWVVGDSGKISATTDGGFTWISQNSGSLNDLASVYFSDESRGYACGLNRTLLTTTNGGNTWTTTEEISDSGLVFSSLCSDPENNIYFISNYGGIYCSKDSGTTRLKIYGFNSYGYTYVNYSFYPTCYAMQITRDSFFRSTDGGNVWEKITAPVEYSWDIYFLNGTTGWIADYWSISSVWHDSASVYMTVDGGETWTTQASLAGKSLKNIVFLESFQGWLSESNKIYYTADSGKTWACQFESAGHIRDIFFLNSRNGWALTYNDKIIKYGPPVVSNEKPDYHLSSKYRLNQNYPNPFNPTTVISYKLPTNDYVKVAVYDILGRELEILEKGYKNAGTHSIKFDGSDYPTGVYIYSITSSNSTLSRKMLLLK